MLLTLLSPIGVSGCHCEPIAHSGYRLITRSPNTTALPADASAAAADSPLLIGKWVSAWAHGGDSGLARAHDAVGRALYAFAVCAAAVSLVLVVAGARRPPGRSLAALYAGVALVSEGLLVACSIDIAFAMFYLFTPDSELGVVIEIALILFVGHQLVAQRIRHRRFAGPVDDYVRPMWMGVFLMIVFLVVNKAFVIGLVALMVGEWLLTIGARRLSRESLRRLRAEPTRVPDPA